MVVVFRSLRCRCFLLVFHRHNNVSNKYKSQDMTQSHSTSIYQSNKWYSKICFWSIFDKQHLMYNWIINTGLSVSNPFLSNRICSKTLTPHLSIPIWLDFLLHFSHVGGDWKYLKKGRFPFNFSNAVLVFCNHISKSE